MNESLRKMVAYISGRAISGEHSSSVFDFSTSKYSNFSGTVSTVSVAVYDYESGSHVSGGWRENNISLYHYQMRSYCNLHIELSGTFSGYDFSSRSHFEGTVNGRSIVLYDYSIGRYFNYSF